ncbi:hypothetical protein TEA_008037 [Camellia sinensis var. sinensis]|uniref:PGG domain-containing protein n=1 Tax=Camellia sinensis var. sinensis TaxID=542762 RepID=A0A4S4DQ44_CAMSN|nr:hypothetical protein TEA_008037 [Camellia sinensis var. sinensis]
MIVMEQVFIQSDVLEVVLDMREKFDAVSDELMHVDKIDTSMLCDDERWLEPTRPDDRNVLTPKELKQAGANHLIVATLIATVTFTAAFTMPGGYNGNDGPNQGMAVLRRAYFFKFFMVADTMAMSFSISAVLIHFFAAITNNRDEVEKLVYIAAYLIICATIAMMFAFIAGTRAVLAHSSGLNISVAVIAGLPLSAFVFTNIAQRVIGPCVDALIRSICT